jgi:DNA-directed RNA polymerase subunit M/transcription elongation factor TFIIS
MTKQPDDSEKTTTSENDGDRTCPRCKYEYARYSEMLPIKEKRGKYYFCHRCGYDFPLDVYLRKYAPNIALPKEYKD